MKKNKVRELCKRGLALFIVGALLVGAPQSTAFAVEDDVNSSTQNNSPTDDLASPTESNDLTNDPVSPAQEDDPTVKVTVSVETDNGEADVTVDRSDAFEQVDPNTAGTVEYEGTGSTINEADGSEVKADVSGDVSSKPDESVLDDQGRVVKESGEITGEEEIVIKTGSEEKPEITSKVDADNQATEVEVNIAGGESGKTAELPADIESLINASIPTQPDWENVEDLTEKDGTYSGSFKSENGETGQISWKTERTENGWTTTQISSTTVEYGLDVDALDWEWVIPGDAEYSEDDTGVITVREEVDAEDGTKVTIITTLNPATGTYSITTEVKTVTTVTFTDNEDGSIEVTEVVTGVGNGDGKLSDVASLAPTSEIQAIGPTNQKNLQYNTKTHKWSLKDKNGPQWLEQHLMNPFSSKMDNAVDSSLRYAECALRSSIFINTKSGQLKGQAVIRKLKQENGSDIYVYCAQHGTPANLGTEYEMINVDDAPYLDQEAAQHVQYIVENGYWGTGDEYSDKLGSLGEVRQLVSEEDREYISHGIALAVTQAAIWYYTGNIDYQQDIFTECFTRASALGNGTYSLKGPLDDGEKKAAMALFDALTKRGESIKEEELENVTDIISQEDITGTSITVNGKVSVDDFKDIIDEAVAEQAKQAREEKEKQAEQANKVKDAYKDKDMYSTDLSLTLAVAKGRVYSEDMKIFVYIDNPDSNGDPIQIGEYTVPQIDENGIIIIPGVILPEGVKITLNLQGTQELKDGAYLFRSDIDYKKSQTMVGYVTGGGTRAVDLNVSMKFDVTDPTATKKEAAVVTTTVTENRDWSSDWARNYSYTSAPNPDPDPNPDPNPDPDPDPDPGEPTPQNEEPEDPDEEIPEDPVPLAEIPEDPVPLTEMPEDPVPLAEIPEEAVPLAARPVTVELLDEEVPLAELPDEDVPLAGEPELVDLFDEDVPLADVPETGDISMLWYAMILIAGSSLLVMTLADAKKRRESLAD